MRPAGNGGRRPTSSRARDLRPRDILARSVSPAGRQTVRFRRRSAPSTIAARGIHRAWSSRADMKIPEILLVETVQRPGSLASVLQVIADEQLVIEHLQSLRRDQGRTLWEITVEFDEAANPLLYARIDALPNARFVGKSDRVFNRHRGGKIRMQSSLPITTTQILRDIYTPGVARVCLAIRDDPGKVEPVHQPAQHRRRRDQRHGDPGSRRHRAARRSAGHGGQGGAVRDAGRHHCRADPRRYARHRAARRRGRPRSHRRSAPSSSRTSRRPSASRSSRRSSGG